MSVGHHSLSPDQALSLFKMYEGQGWAVKGQMISLVAWLTPFVFGLIAFSVNGYCGANPPRATASLAGLAALGMSVFMVIMIVGTLKRADAYYGNADKVIKEAKDLLPEEIYKLVSHEKEKNSVLALPFFRLGMRRVGLVYILIAY